MDFVVAGFGLGAILVLIGFTIRDLVALRRGASGEGSRNDPWPATTRAVGGATSAGGIVICVGTGAALLAGAGDAAGERIVAALSVVSLVAVAVWSAISVRRIRRRVSSATVAGMDDLTVAGLDDLWDSPPRGVSAWPVGPPEWRTQEPRWADIDSREEQVAATDEVDVSQVEGPAKESDRAETEKTPIPPEVPPPATPELAESKPPAGSSTWPTSGGSFRSPLLADVGADVAGEDGQTFRSSLLADLTTDDARKPDDRRFASSILADLEGAEERDSTGETPDGAPSELPSPEVPSSGERVVDADEQGRDRQEPTDNRGEPASPDRRATPADGRGGKPGGGGLTAAG